MPSSDFMLQFNSAVMKPVTETEIKFTTSYMQLENMVLSTPNETTEKKDGYFNAQII